MTAKNLLAPAWSIRRNRVLDAVADVPDVRDQLFAPSLRPLRPRLLPFDTPPDWWSDRRVRDQGSEPSCVGHALAAVIDHMRAAALVESGAREPGVVRTLDRPWVSAPMLYYMARFHDEWVGEDYAGSSIRGGLKGFFYNGACSIEDVEREYAQPRQPIEADGDASWYMTKRLVEGARTIQLGAYYRVRPRLADMHCALSEANAMVVSATTHDGWFTVERATATIRFDPGARSARGRHAKHAFAVVGYDELGFWVQNSWGTGWGRGGFARWLYEDWAANVIDAWVLRLAVMAPAGPPSGHAPRLTAYGSKIDRSETHFLGWRRGDASGPSRLDVLGHLVPFRDGRLDRYGPYNVNRQTLRETFKLIRQRYAYDLAPAGSPFAPDHVTLPPEQRHYRHILIYFLGGWADEARLAHELADLIPVFKRLGIYPFFVSWDTSLFDALDRFVRGTIEQVAALTSTTPASHRSMRDRLVEGRISIPGNRILRDLRCGARRIFAFDQPDPDFAAVPPVPGEGADCLARLFEAMAPFYRDRSLSYHFAAHGFGAQVLIECLAQQDQIGTLADIASCTLISPIVAAHRIGHQKEADAPSLFASLLPRSERSARRRRPEQIMIERLRLIAMDEQALRTDRFSSHYGCAWPELWAYVMGRDNLARAEHRAIHLPGGASSAAPEPRYQLPLIALPEEARALVEAGVRKGFDVAARYVRLLEDDADTSLHHELGFHRTVLDALIGEILGGNREGTFSSGGRTIRLVAEPR